MSSKCKNDNNCIRCTESGCNAVPNVRRSLLSCVQCNKSTECGFSQDEEKAIPCKNQVTVGSAETCYTNFNSGDLNKSFWALLDVGIIEFFNLSFKMKVGRSADALSTYGRILIQIRSTQQFVQSQVATMKMSYIRIAYLVSAVWKMNVPL